MTQFAQFVAETRKAIAAGIGAAVLILGPKLLAGQVDGAAIAAAAGAFVAAAVLVYFVKNQPPAPAAATPKATA